MGEKEKRRMPKHVAIILDGNRRWAEKRGLGTSEGHEAGARRLMENAKDCFAMGTNTISLFAFSTENWERPKVIMEMKTFQEFLHMSNEEVLDHMTCLVCLFSSHASVKICYLRNFSFLVVHLIQ